MYTTVFGIACWVSNCPAHHSLSFVVLIAHCATLIRPTALCQLSYQTSLQPNKITTQRSLSLFQYDLKSHITSPQLLVTDVITTLSQEHNARSVLDVLQSVVRLALKGSYHLVAAIVTITLPQNDITSRFVLVLYQGCMKVMHFVEHD